MTRSSQRRIRLAAAGVAVVAVAGLAASAGAATFLFDYTDPPGTGFNDPTPVAPVGGNPGTSLGEQRRIAFEYAASIWGDLLVSPVEIRIEAEFVSGLLPCFPTAATLAVAGPLHCAANFPGAELADTWYPIALANKLAGADLVPLPLPSPHIPPPRPPSASDILVLVDADIDDQVCLGTIDWYYGLDLAGGSDLDLVETVLHELAHGLGFTNFFDETTGDPLLGLPDVYSKYLLDTFADRHWSEMSPEQVVASVDSVDHLVWDGLHVTRRVPEALALGRPTLAIQSPPVLAGVRRVGPAEFGPPLAPSPARPAVSVQCPPPPLRVGGSLVRVDDGVAAPGGSAADACEPITPASAAEVKGNIAMVEVSFCAATVAVKNAQDAGATAVLVIDDRPDRPPRGIRGADPSIVIPAARVTATDGKDITAALAKGPVRGVLSADATRFAGADSHDRALLHSPNPYQPGSSISHWDFEATPDLLMEPAAGPSPKHDVDITGDLFDDLGWRSDGDGVADGRDACLGSDLSPTVVLRSPRPAPPPESAACDSGVENRLDPQGCSRADLVAGCARVAADHAEFGKCVRDLTASLVAKRALTPAEKAAIDRCAAMVDIP